MSSHKGCDGRQLEPCPFCGGETAQDVARALCMSVPNVYKAVALVARNPRPFRERWERCQRELAERGQ